MKKVFVIYTADGNLMNDSKQMIAVCTTKKKAIDLIKPQLEMAAIESFSDLSYLNSNVMLSDLLNNLNTINQTQSLSENYMIEEIELNTL